jgi:hypothetical protein
MGLRQRKWLRGCVGIVATYALFFHLLISGLMAAELSLRGETALHWTQSLCLSGANSGSAAPDGPGDSRQHVIHCVLCAGACLAGAPTVESEIEPGLAEVFDPILPDSAAPLFFASWSPARAPPRG